MNDDLEQRHHDLTLERQELGEAPMEPRIFVTDCTSERLVRLMEAAGESLALISGEARKSLAMFAGLYNGREDTGVVLPAHAGDRIVVERQGRPAVILNKPCLSMGLGVQPDALQRLGENPDLCDSGLLERFLYVSPDWPFVPYPRDSIDGATQARYNRVITTLLAWPCTRDRRGVPEPQTVRLSPAAFDIWKEFNDGAKRMAIEASTTMPVNLQRWLTKLGEAAARIALIMHTVEAVEHGGELAPISAEVMNRAADISTCLFSHAKRAFGVIGEDADAVLCRRSWEWANAHRAKLREMREGQGLGRIEAIKPSDLVRQGIANDAKAATRALDQLEARGWLQAVEWDNPQAPTAKKHVFYFLRPVEATQ